MDSRSQTGDRRLLRISLSGSPVRSRRFEPRPGARTSATCVFTFFRSSAVVGSDELQPSDIQRLYLDRVDSGLSPTTVRHLHEILNKAFGQAARWGLISRNPAALVQPPRRAHHEMRTLDPSQVRALLDVVADDRLEALYVLAVTTGMRQGELLALRWRDVDLATGRLRVTGTLYWPRGGTPAISEPKTARSRRQLQLSGAAVSALRRHAARNAAERLAHAEWDDPIGLVFTNELGRPVDASNLRRSFTNLLPKAGLPGSASTTCATRQRRSCSAAASIRRSRRRCSGTRASPSPSTCTRT